MTLLGKIFMTLSWSFIIILGTFCFYNLMKNKDRFSHLFSPQDREHVCNRPDMKVFYVLPSVVIYGGVKTAFRCLSYLKEEGYNVIAATPNAQSPRWFEHNIPIIDRKQIFTACSSQDCLLFSYPYDLEFVSDIECNTKVFHIQGVDLPGHGRSPATADWMP